MRFGLTLTLWAALAFAAATGTTQEPSAPPPSETRELANLRAFARLYGVVRFFHPSDEAASVDWNRVAVLGVSRVRDANDTAELKSTLESLVHGIAPTVDILDDAERSEIAPIPKGDEVVSWQYLGPGFPPGYFGIYRAKRTGRPAVAGAGNGGWTGIAQWIDARPYRGKPFAVQAQVRAESGAEIGAWAQVELADGTMGFLDDMRGRMEKAGEWTEIGVEGVIDDAAERLLVGGWSAGIGDAWFDDFSLTIDGVQTAIANPGFEEGASGWDAEISRFGAKESGFTYDVVDAAHGSSKALRISEREDLFKGHAAAGEIAVVDLGDGLEARVPIALWSRNGHTLPIGDPAALKAALEQVHATLEDSNARLADLIVAWSVFDQFYPYFDVVSVDWQAVLDRTLRDGLDDASGADHRVTLRRLVAALEDGHGRVDVPGAPEASLPLGLAWAEGSIVVTESSVPGVSRGDVIVAIDGVSASDALDAEMALYSGSVQWRRAKALRSLGERPAGEPIALRVARPGESLEVSVLAGTPPERLYSQPAIAMLGDGVWYVDLTRAWSKDIEPMIETLAKAQGVIFDLRGYPAGPDVLLRHLLVTSESDRWMHTAEVVRPALTDAQRMRLSWLSDGWDQVPADPRIGRNIVFLTDGRAISYAEAVLGYAEALNIDIVGSPTAGANGDIRRVGLPTGSVVTFTGLKVTRHDGTRFHLEGIRPTVPVEPTVDGIRAGQDEVLAAAVALVRARIVRP